MPIQLICHTKPGNNRNFQIDGASRYFGVWLWQLVHLLILVCSFQWCVLFLCLAKLCVNFKNTSQTSQLHILYMPLLFSSFYQPANSYNPCSLVFYVVVYRLSRETGTVFSKDICTMTSFDYNYQNAFRFNLCTVHVCHPRAILHKRKNTEYRIVVVEWPGVNSIKKYKCTLQVGPSYLQIHTNLNPLKVFTSSR